MRETTIQGHSRSSVIVPIDEEYIDFLLALNGNLTSVYYRSWDITPSLHTTIPHATLPGETVKDGQLEVGGRNVSECPEYWTVQP